MARMWCVTGVALLACLAVTWGNNCEKPKEFRRVRYSHGDVFHEKKLRNTQQCYNLCWSTMPCTAVNWSTKTRKCSLLAKKAPNRDALDVHFNMLYGEVTRPPMCRAYSTPCDNRPCKAKSTCISYGSNHDCNPARPPRLQCGKPPVLKNAAAKVKRSPRGPVATYKCKSGYKFKGPNPRNVCKRSNKGSRGKWTGLIGECRRLKCKEPTPIPNADISEGESWMDSVRQVACLNDPKVTASMVCHRNETWSRVIINCPVKCSEAPAIENADISAGDIIEGSARIYSCKDGRLPSGNNTITCLGNGTWTSTDFTCSETASGAVGNHTTKTGEGDTEKGNEKNKDEDSNAVNKNINKDAQDNKNINKDAQDYTNKNKDAQDNTNKNKNAQDNTNEKNKGEDSNAVNKNKNKDAQDNKNKNKDAQDNKNKNKDAQDYTNKNKDAQDNTNKNKNAQDNTNEKNKGEDSNAVNKNKNKDAQDNKNKNKDAQDYTNQNKDAQDYTNQNKDAQDKDGGKIKEPSENTDAGKTDADADTVLNKNKNISAQTSEVACGDPPSVGNATSDVNADNTRVDYTCLENYSPDGETFTKCEGGDWLPPSLTCNLIDCGPPKEKGNKTVSYNGTTVGSVATYQCNEGYADGASLDTITCEKDGKWSLNKLPCTPVNCSGQPGVANIESITGTYTYSMTAQLKCKDKFAAYGGNVATCSADGTWKVADFKCLAAEPRVLIAVKDTRSFHVLHMDGSKERQLVVKGNDSIQDVDYSLELDKFFWVEPDNLRSAKLDSKTAEHIISETGIGGFVRVDGREKLLFYAVRGNETDIMKMDIPTKKTTKLNTVDTPLALEIDQKNKHVYWAEWVQAKQVMRMNYDGGDKKSLIKLGQCELGPWAVHLDGEDNLYWSVNDEVRHRPKSDLSTNGTTLSSFKSICDGIRSHAGKIYVSCTNDSTVSVHDGDKPAKQLTLATPPTGEKFITIIP